MLAAPAIIRVVCTSHHKALFPAGHNYWTQLLELSLSELVGLNRYTHVCVAGLFRYRIKVKCGSCSGQRGLAWGFGLCSQEVWREEGEGVFLKGLSLLRSFSIFSHSSLRQREAFGSWQLTHVPQKPFQCQQLNTPGIFSALSTPQSKAKVGCFCPVQLFWGSVAGHASC